LRDEREKRQKKGDNLKQFTDAISLTSPVLASDVNTSLGSLSDSIGLEVDPISEFNVDDWMFWDQLMQDDQGQSNQQ
jgi:hypothetical protein